MAVLALLCLGTRNGNVLETRGGRGFLPLHILHVAEHSALEF